MTKENEKSIESVRPPVVVIMGHIDHGKSTLLDYIRKTNVVSGEAGGITQHMSAYEVINKDASGKERKITFLDTPGHEAFSKMRSRGARAADIAILMVSAEDSVKAQTLEALATILEEKIPYIVAINKIDKPGANIEKTKMDLAEKGVYLEGYGGDIPCVEISAKAGTNIPNLLDMILLVADISELKADHAVPAEGVVIESNLDTKRGVTATLIIKNGTLSKGMFIVAGCALVGTKMIEDFMGKSISEATFSSPIRIIGFDRIPAVGSIFRAYETKREAEIAQTEAEEKSTNCAVNFTVADGVKVIPIIIKTDVDGTGEAVLKEILKLELDNVKFKVLDKSVGAIGENDMKLANSDKETIVIGFNVKMDSRARDVSEKLGINVQTFDIIYKISDYLREKVEERKPRIETLESTGTLKILKTFNRTKEKQVVGGRVLTGVLRDGSEVRILRRDFEIGRAKISGIERNKIKAKEVAEGEECGILIESKAEIAAGDVLEAFTMVTK